MPKMVVKVLHYLLGSEGGGFWLSFVPRIVCNIPKLIKDTYIIALLCSSHKEIGYE